MELKLIKSLLPFIKSRKNPTGILEFKYVLNNILKMNIETFKTHYKILKDNGIKHYDS